MCWSTRRWALSSLAGLSCPRWQKAQSVPLRQSPWTMSTQGLRHNSGCPWLPMLQGADSAGGPSGEAKPGGGRKNMLVTLLGGSRHGIKAVLEAKMQGDSTRISGVSCIILYTKTRRGRLQQPPSLLKDRSRAGSVARKTPQSSDSPMKVLAASQSPSHEQDRVLYMEDIGHRLALMRCIRLLREDLALTFALVSL